MDLNKEKELTGGIERVQVPEGVKPSEAPKSSELNLETLSWMEKIEKKFARVPNQTSDITDDSIVIQQPQTQQPPITLPITQQQMQSGKKAKTSTGIAWLVTWAIRKIKMITKLGGKVRLQDIPEAK